MTLINLHWLDRLGKGQIMKKVLISEKIDDDAVQLLQKNGFDVEISPAVDEATLTEHIKGAFGLIMRSSKLLEGVVDSADQLRIISRTGTGIDNVNIDDATKNHVLVARVNGANAYSVAEYVITTMLAMSRRIYKSDRLFKAGQIVSTHGESLPGLAVKYDLNGHEIRGKRLGILGLGRIGKIIAKLGDALGMDIIGYDPYVKASDVKLTTDLNDIYNSCDFISVNMPLTKETKNLIAAKELGQMKDSAFIVNAGRGGIINETDLADALNNGVVAGAALDVFTEEPPRSDSPLLTAKNILLTAHIGGTTYEASKAVAIGAAQAVIDYSTGKKPQFTVNYKDLKN